MQNISEFLRYNIRKVRIQRDLSHEQIADLLGISPRAYTNLENGATQIDIIRLEKIADILQTNIDHLLHFHEGSSQNHFYNSSHCIVANNDIFVIAREVYEDVRKVGEQWREMYITEKHARLLSDEQWQEKLAAKENELLKLTEKLTIQYIATAKWFCKMICFHQFR